jgi:hypothetical protein
MARIRQAHIYRDVLFSGASLDFLLQLADVLLQALHGQLVALPDQFRQALEHLLAGG